MFEYENLKNYIFKLDPELAHDLTFYLMQFTNFCPSLLNPIAKNSIVLDKILSQNIWGREFYNPVGLGAGFDKNGVAIKALSALGFGYLEIGTVTPKAQRGNPKPRLFRFPEEESLQNGFGFNNDGSYAVSKRVKKLYPFVIPLGINIGKNKDTKDEDAIKDYEILIKNFKDLADYLVINISSPNTPNLRTLQNADFIKALFSLGKSLTSKPILLKIAPDLEVEYAINLCYEAINAGASGVVATNTTIDYSLLANPKNFGGISGKALKDKSFNLFVEIAKELHKKTTLISVGGIDSGEEAYKRIKAGASLVQVYSAIVFKGPSLIKNINLELAELLKRDGFSNIKDAVGVSL